VNVQFPLVTFAVPREGERLANTASLAFVSASKIVGKKAAVVSDNDEPGSFEPKFT
jgi:hypothetical protein